MSIEHTPCFGYGRLFKTASEAQAWFREHYKNGLAAATEAALDGDFLDYFSEPGDDLSPTLRCLDLLSGRDFALLYSFDMSGITGLKHSIDMAEKLWALFFDEPGEVISQVITH